jgi:hypothetical protein
MQGPIMGWRVPEIRKWGIKILIGKPLKKPTCRKQRK